MPALLRAFDRLRRRLLIHRRLLAALCAGLAVLLTVSAIRPPDPATTELWTAARLLPSGTVLATDDLRPTAFRPGSEPASAVRSVESLLGRTLAVPLGEGDVLTSAKVVGDDLLTGHPGRAAVPLRIPDGDVVGLLHVGDQVDVVATDPQGRRPSERLAIGATVLALPEPSRDSAGPGLSGRLVVLAVPSGEVARVTEAGTSLFLTVVWNR